MQPNKPRAAQAEVGEKLRQLIAERYRDQPKRKKSRREQVREAQRYVPGKPGMGKRGIS